MRGLQHYQPPPPTRERARKRKKKTLEEEEEVESEEESEESEDDSQTEDPKSKSKSKKLDIGSYPQKTQKLIKNMMNDNPGQHMQESSEIAASQSRGGESIQFSFTDTKVSYNNSMSYKPSNINGSVNTIGHQEHRSRDNQKQLESIQESVKESFDRDTPTKVSYYKPDSVKAEESYPDDFSSYSVSKAQESVPAARNKFNNHDFDHSNKSKISKFSKTEENYSYQDSFQGMDSKSTATLKPTTNDLDDKSASAVIKSKSSLKSKSRLSLDQSESMMEVCAICKKRVPVEQYAEHLLACMASGGAFGKLSGLGGKGGGKKPKGQLSDEFRESSVENVGEFSASRSSGLKRSDNDNEYGGFDDEYDPDF